MPSGAVRANQRSRTRRDLLEAALRASAEGRVPTFDAIADEAQVSRATAYRYFPNLDALLAEASLHAGFPDVDCLADASDDPIERLFIVDEAVERLVAENEPALRVMVASAAKVPLHSNAPPRQNRRLPLIEAALSPARPKFAPDAYRRLTEALCLVIGTESMLVFTDVLKLPPDEARRARHWTIRSLVKVALDE